MMWWLLTALASQPCDLSGEADAPFVARHFEAETTTLLVELWVDAPEQVPWARRVLQVMSERSLPATVVLPLSDAPPPELLALAAAPGDERHGVALRLRSADVPTDVLAPVRPLRKKMRPYEDAGRIRTTASALAGRGSEALLGKAGVRNLVQLEAPSTGVPRLAGHFEGQQPVHVILPPGPYRGACGSSPLVGPFTPAAADRVARALLASASEPTTTPIVRLALDGNRGDEHDHEVLGRWLDEVVLPARVAVRSPNEARLAALQGFRRAPDGPTAPPRTTGRLLPVPQLQEAARQLDGLATLPYRLPAGLAPTEAFVGWLLLASHSEVPETVRLPRVAGPVSDHAGSGGAERIDRAAFATAVGRLAKALPEELPAALPVDGRLLSTAQWLTGLASYVRGDDPVVARPIASPDPHARGLGWGTTESTIEP
jgi:hypothetical protein